MSLVLVQDTREKIGKHDEIADYCKSISLPIVRKTLNVGDYRLANLDENGNITFLNNISVDVKSSGRDGLQELANDLYRDKLAFNKKYKKCLKDGIQLIVLVETKAKTPSDIIKWKSPHGRINGKLLKSMVRTVELSYGVKFYFCDREHLGMNIIKLLRGETR